MRCLSINLDFLSEKSCFFDDFLYFLSGIEKVNFLKKIARHQRLVFLFLNWGIICIHWKVASERYHLKNWDCFFFVGQQNHFQDRGVLFCKNKISPEIEVFFFRLKKDFLLKKTGLSKKQYYFLEEKIYLRDWRWTFSEKI